MTTNIIPSRLSTKMMLNQLNFAFMDHNQQTLRDNSAPISFTELLSQEDSAIRQLEDLQNVQRKSVKRRTTYQKYSEQLKKQIIFSIDVSIEKGCSYYQIIRQLADVHSTSRKNIQRWYSNAKESKAAQNRGKKAMFPKMEEKLIEFINLNHPSITRMEIIKKGRELVLQCYGEQQFNSFRGSNRWYYKFINRHAELRQFCSKQSPTSK